MELRFFLFQTVELAQCGMNVRALGQTHPIAQDRFQRREVTVPLGPEAGAGLRLCQSGDGADLPRADGLCQRIFCAGVKPQLVGLFGPGLAVRFAGELGFDFQLTAGDAQPGQPLAPLILRDFEHPRTESFQRRGGAGVFVEAGQQFVHTLQSAGILPLQGHAKPAGKDVPPGDGRDDVLRRQAARVQHLFHQALVAEGQCLVPFGLLCAEIHESVAQTVGKLAQQRIFARAGQVHFIDEHEGRDMIPPQQTPERLGMALDAVGAADDQHSVVEHLQSALRLGGKVHMAGGVQQGDIRTSRFQQGLLGKDGDPTRLFQRVGVEEGIFVIHPAQLADAARAVEHCLGEGGLAGVYMGKDAHHQLFFAFFCHVRCPHTAPAMRPMMSSAPPRMRFESMLQ